MAAKAFSILSQVPCITSSINAVTVEVGLALSGLLLEFCDFLMPTSPVFRFSPLNQELCPRHTRTCRASLHTLATVFDHLRIGGIYYASQTGPPFKGQSFYGPFHNARHDRFGFYRGGAGKGRKR